MKRQRQWNAKTEVNAALINFREKRKWQIALRRYILENNKSSYYAPFFGVDTRKFREWIEIQFDTELDWQNFSKAWQFDHIVPVAYFDFNDKEDMRLCWNFTNIRVEKTDLNKNRGNRIDVLTAKTYFEVLFQRTGYIICSKMIDKITQIEISQIKANEKLERFIIENKAYLDNLSDFTSYEFDKLNTGVPFESVLFEVNFLKRFNS